MKATGIVRRIDDLGRVVIPKEIRRTQLIRVGDPLEIYVSNNNEVIFKKYSPMGELSSFAQSYIDILNKNTGVCAIVTDRDQVIAASINNKELLQNTLTKEYENVVELRRTTNVKEQTIHVSKTSSIVASVISPIICQGDIIGSVALISISQDMPGVPFAASEDSASAHVHVAACLMGRQMEE